MNKNKGFIGIGLIIAIVLGAIIIGGGAYYLGKSGSKQVVINPENILPNVENQNLPVDNSQQVNVASECTSNSAPSIKVLSPNGGETYTIGQKIIIRWKTCNINNARIFAELYGPDSKNWSNLTDDIDKGLDDDGEENVMVNATKEGEYVLRITANTSLVGQVAKDESDSSFTINAVPKTVSTTSCTSDKGNVMTYARALEIAKTSSCNNVGKFTGEYDCNKNSGGLVDVYMEPTNKPGCAFACRVSIDTGKTEEGWMCTGAR